MKKRLISIAIVVSLVLSYIVLSKILSTGKTVDYGIADGDIMFSGNNDITDTLADQGLTVAENEYFIMQITDRADIRIIHKPTGRVWNSVPGEDYGNSKYSSSLILSYFSDKSTKSVLYSSKDSVNKKQFKVYSADAGVVVEYIFGEMTSENLYPEVISEKSMKKLLKRMNEEDAEYFLRRYTFYSLSNYTDADQEYLLQKYPRLKDENLYALTDNNIQRTGKRMNSILESIGYTASDRDADNYGYGSKRENPLTFKVAIAYKLTERGFKVTLDLEDLAFYKEYPVDSLQLLPYFDCFTKGETGYFVLPSGSGAIAEVTVADNTKEQNISLPVYGDNYAVTKQLNDYTHQCVFPVFGQYKNSSGYLCIINNGAEQATVNSEKNSYYSSSYTSFQIIDTELYTSSQSIMWLPNREVSIDNNIELEYVLLSGVNENNAYSQMANIYRNYLAENGTLTKNSFSSVPFVPEFVNTINYNTMSLGFIPTNKEFSMTSFENLTGIVKDFGKYIDSSAMNVLITGWNKGGLNKSEFNKINYSSAAGGKKRFNSMINTLESEKINYYIDCNFTTFSPYKFDNYNSMKNSVRGINNSVIKLNKLDAKTFKYKPTGMQLISSELYKELWETYSNLPVGGIGVNQLSTFLYGNYSNGKSVTRSDSVSSVTGVLSKIKSSGRSVLGDGGNLYALKHLDIINNLPVNSSQSNYFDRDIPFVQMVLHGFTAYVSPPLNGVSDKETMLLKLIETGSGLHYKITDNIYNNLFDTDFSYLYNTQFSVIKDDIRYLYEKLNTALTGLGNKTIIAHEYVARNVVCVTYEDGTKIYVNYSNHAFNIGSIAVQPKSYYRINA